MCGPPRDAPVAPAASVAVRGVGRQHAGHLRWPASATAGPRRSAVAPALATRSFRFAPGVLRRPRAGAALPLPAAAALLRVCSAVSSALTPRSPRVRLPLSAWCVAPVLGPRRPYPRDWRCPLPGFGDAADNAGRMGGGGRAKAGGAGVGLCHTQGVGLVGCRQYRAGKPHECVWSVAGFFPQAEVDCVHRQRHTCRRRKKSRRGMKKKPFVVIEPLLHVTKHQLIHSH